MSQHKKSKVMTAPPQIGDKIYYRGVYQGIVYSVEDTLCYHSKDGKRPESKNDIDNCKGCSMFIFYFPRNGKFNNLHHWSA